MRFQHIAFNVAAACLPKPLFLPKSFRFSQGRLLVLLAENRAAPSGPAR
jgi:hypothetical protein